MRILNFYKLIFGYVGLLIVFIFSLGIWIRTSIEGLLTGHYIVNINTNSIGENWIEVILLALIFPAALMVASDGFLRIALGADSWQVVAQRIRQQRRSRQRLESQSETVPHQT